MSEADDKKPDLSDIENMMSGFDMTPEWARNDPGVQAQPVRERRDDRRGPGPRKPRSDRKNPAGQRVKPKRDYNDGGQGGHRGGEHRGGGRREYKPRPPRLPVHVDFIPEKARLSKVVKIIRASHRAFPLDEIAGKFMENPGFLAIKLTVRDKAPNAEEMKFFQCKANRMVFADKASCEAYILAHGIPEYYEEETREVDPPAGNFVVVGRTRKGNVLLGPPNWHGYAKNVDEAWQEQAPHLSREDFVASIEMVRDEEVIAEWKQQAAVQKFYREKRVEPAVEEAATTAVVEPPSAEQNPEPEAAAEEQPAQTEEVAEVAPVEEVETPASENVEAAAEEEAKPSAEGAVEEPAAEEAVEDNRPYERSREQVEAEFRDKHLAGLLIESRRAIMPGYLADKPDGDPAIQSAIQFHLKREQSKPSSIIFALRPAFKHMRLHLFRHNGRMHVSGVHPNPLPADTQIADDLRRIIEYVTQHEGCPSKEVLIALGPEQGEGVEPTPELVSHLHWLIEKGHVIEFSDGTLSLPHNKRSQASA